MGMQKATIENFKSIRRAELNLRRVNLFIGEPNAGKSNILEALSLLTYRTSNLNELVRLDLVSQLFYDFDTTQPFVVASDGLKVQGEVKSGVLKLEASLTELSHLALPFEIKYNTLGAFVGGSRNDGNKNLPVVVPYRFNPNIKFSKTESLDLDSPFGQNLPSVIFSQKDLRLRIQTLLEGLGYKLLFKPNEGSLEIYKEHEGGFSISFPYLLISDTVRKMMFYMAAIESNKGVTVILEEPEANTFPLYIKFLAEMASANKRNQYLITTHNPYFLTTAIEKTSREELAVHLVESVDHETIITTLDDDGISKILDLTSDVFLNLTDLK